ncbi:MAG: hypothetical protein NkDv07_0911 [Candidatus Improbicoccus devescovinae]|nr:MAG: hypothetical protein NkDv07_0911 [Candidatus Improbicoccus devescovinae]
MGMFENFFLKTKAAIGVISGKTGRFIDISKLKIDIAELENRQKKNYEKIGRLYYTFKTQNKAVDENELESVVSGIDALKEKIARIHDEIDSIKNKVVCNKCKNKNEKASSYCTKCGTDLVHHDEESKKNDSSDVAKDQGIQNPSNETTNEDNYTAEKESESQVDPDIKSDIT